MIQNLKLLSLGTGVVAICCQAAFAQTLPPVILQVDVINQTNYESDVPDYSKLATDATTTTGAAAANFAYFITIGDIVAVNGKPAAGTFIGRQASTNLTPNPKPGQAIADITRNNIHQLSWEILAADGTPIGTIIATGMGQGSAPPGSPLIQVQGNSAIDGGTGAFLGARGQTGSVPTGVGSRLASATEDPANRRLRSGGALQYILTVIPMFRPEILVTANVPAVTHSSDYSPVTPTKPAAAGEVLSLFMTGLGPTRPGVDPGKPFPVSPPSQVNSPVEVTVNGVSTEVISAVGIPGEVDGYQVNFRMPPDSTSGTAAIQVSAAWIPGHPITIPVH